MKRAAACVVSIAAVTAVQVASTTSDVGAGGPLDHCVLHAAADTESGSILTPPIDCYPTLSEAIEAAGGISPIGRLTRTSAASASSSVLAVHFDGANRGGQSLTVSGASCDATVNLSSAWVDRISSTWNICGTVRFFDDFDKGGVGETTGVTTNNLGALNNIAASVYYAP